MCKFDTDDTRDMEEKWERYGDTPSGMLKCWLSTLPVEGSRDEYGDDRSLEIAGCRSGRAIPGDGIPLMPGEAVLCGVTNPDDVEGVRSGRISSRAWKKYEGGEYRNYRVLTGASSEYFFSVSSIIKARSTPCISSSSSSESSDPRTSRSCS